MKLKFDFKELETFADNLKNKYNRETAFMTATQNIAKVLHQHILQRTPIKTGNLRKMWSAGDNLLFTVNQVNGGYEVILVNTARNGGSNGFMYGIAVEDGHRTPTGGWVQGRFFVRNSINVTEQSVEQIVMKELQRWFDRC